MSAIQEDVSAAISFIRLVEQNPCLWNCSLKSYSRADLTTIAWKKISEKLNDTEQNCRDRWKNIRTAFGRSIKPPRSRSGGKLKRAYYLSTYLDFLRPYMKGASTHGNVLLEDKIDHDTNATGTQDEEDTSQGSPQVSPVNEASLESENEIHQDEFNFPLLKTSFKRRKITSIQNESDLAYMLELEKQKEMKTIQEEQQDGDWFFFRSLHHDFNTLTDKRKRYLKLKFATLLYDELDQAEVEAEALSSMYSCGSSSTTFRSHNQHP